MIRYNTLYTMFRLGVIEIFIMINYTIIGDMAENILYVSDNKYVNEGSYKSLIIYIESM